MRRLKRLVVCAAEGETTKETPEAAEPADEEKAEDAADEPEAKGWEGEEEQDAEETDEKEEKEEGEGEEDGGEESAEKKPSKWTCLDCGSPNFASSTECDKCGASRPSPEEAALMQARNDAKDEIAKVMDSFLRDQADLQNYRREHTESMSRAEDLGKRDALKKLLPINEDIEAAIAEPEGMDEKAKAIFDSYSLLFRKVGDVWTKGGVETFSAEAGEKFDPVRHVMVEEREASEDEKPGTVAEIVKSGWKCDGKVVLPSQVVVLSASVAEEEEARRIAAEKVKRQAEEEAQKKAAEQVLPKPKAVKTLPELRARGNSSSTSAALGVVAFPTGSCQMSGSPTFLPLYRAIGPRSRWQSLYQAFLPLKSFCFQLVLALLA